MPKRKIGQSMRDPHVAVLEEELQHALSDEGQDQQKKKRGHILIEFYSEEEFERIMIYAEGGKKE